MSDIAIKVENLSKAYQLGDFNTGALTQDIERWWALLRGKEDPFLKIGEANDRAVKGTSDVVWSLKDINFDVKEGDAVGIIGRNGAGKSTLLKVLSRVTSPTTGNIKVKGRIASLLEVGTGFHPELTGGENIYLNGAIMGMTKREIKQKYDEIIDFAGVERYINTPVKRYSSGMYVRLAFAVAAYLESEILIVDEVLAVGDAEFQKKCLGKMGEVSKGEGRTVLFVSHNMAAITNLCTKTIILNNGGVKFIGTSHDGIKNYLDNQSGTGLSHYINSNLGSKSGCEEIKVVNNKEEIVNEFKFNESVILSIKYKISSDNTSAKLAFRIVDNMERIVFTSEKQVNELIDNNNNISIKIVIPPSILVPNNYTVTIASHIPNILMIEMLKEVVHFSIIETGSNFFMYDGTDYGCVFVDCQWNKN